MAASGQGCYHSAHILVFIIVIIVIIIIISISIVIIITVGMGFSYQMMQFQDERLMAAASCLTPMVRHIEDTIGYTRSPAAPHLPRERKVFGAPLLDNQYVHFRLAELLTEVEMLRSTVYRATDLFVAGESVNWAQ